MVGALVVVVEACAGADTDGFVVVVDELDELPQAARTGAIPTIANATPTPRPRLLTGTRTRATRAHHPYCPGGGLGFSKRLT